MNTKTFNVPVSNGIFEHCAAMGDAVWLFLLYIDKTTREIPDAKRPGCFIGLVYGTAPYHDKDAASTLGVV